MRILNTASAGTWALQIFDFIFLLTNTTLHHLEKRFFFRNHAVSNSKKGMCCRG
jgi:hypothetical protein